MRPVARVARELAESAKLALAIEDALAAARRTIDEAIALHEKSIAVGRGIDEEEEQRTTALRRAVSSHPYAKD